MKVLFVIVSLFGFLYPLQAAFTYNPCQGKQEEDLVRSWLSCSAIHRCNGNGGGDLYVCPVGSYFDSVKGYCRFGWFDGNQCDQNDPCKSYENENYFPHWDCRNYIQCDNKVGSVKSCPLGLLYNANTRACGYAQNVNCYWWQ